MQLEFVVPVAVRVVLIGRLPLGPTLQKAITVQAVRPGLNGRPCLWPSASNPRTMTIAVKPRKMCWCRSDGPTETCAGVTVLLRHVQV